MKRAFALALVFTGACVKHPQPPDAGEPAVSKATCAHYVDPAEKVGLLPPELPECSGLAASRAHPGLYYAHNDSGGGPEVYALRDDGTLVARLRLHDAKAHDYEDIAVGPCSPGGASCVYVGDVGDNTQSRAEAVVYAFPEPAQLQGDAGVDVTALRFRYPDGPHDCEALFVDARTAQLFVLTKDPETLGTIYEVPRATDGGAAEASVVAHLRAPFDSDHLTTAADLHPSGERLLLRTYSRVFELRVPDAGSVAALATGAPIEIPGAPQQQAEAAAYLADGGGYLLGTEGAAGPLYEVRCR